MEQYNREIVEIDLNSIIPNPFKPRKVFNENEITLLADSIKEVGLLSPILVRSKAQYFEIIAGERRVRALASLGIRKIPAIIKQVTDDEMVKISLVENIQRENLHLFDQGISFHKLYSEFGYTASEIAENTGIEKTDVVNKIKVLNLSPVILKDIYSRDISEKHILSLLKLENEKEQLYVFNKIIEDSLTADEAENLVNEIINGEKIPGFTQGVGVKTHRQSGDMRIYYNTIKQAVEAVRSAGIETKIKRDETDDELIITIRVQKP